MGRRGPEPRLAVATSNAAVLTANTFHPYCVMLDFYRSLDPTSAARSWRASPAGRSMRSTCRSTRFAVPALIAVWHITNAQAGLLATSALVISAFGGWIAGMLRRPHRPGAPAEIMVAWFAFFTFLSGFTQNFEQLLVVRGLQGFGFGGEWAAGSVLMGEVVRGADRGKAVGMVQSAWAWVGPRPRSSPRSSSSSSDRRSPGGCCSSSASCPRFWCSLSAARSRAGDLPGSESNPRDGAARSHFRARAPARRRSSAPRSRPARRAATTRSRPSCRHSCGPSAISRCSAPAAISRSSSSARGAAISSAPI